MTTALALGGENEHYESVRRGRRVAQTDSAGEEVSWAPSGGEGGDGALFATATLLMQVREQVPMTHLKISVSLK
jgi:hypothetical protein